MSRCKGLTKNGDACSRLPRRGSQGYCAYHMPEGMEPAPEEARSKISGPTWDDQELKRQEICDLIRDIKDLETLKECQKEVAIAIVSGAIDSKSGPSLVQLFKHQAELIKRTAEKDEQLSQAQGGTLIEKSKSMTNTEAFVLLQNFQEQIARMTKEAKKSPALLGPPAETVEAQETVEVKPHADQSGQPNDTDSERRGRLQEAPADSTEIF